MVAAVKPTPRVTDYHGTRADCLESIRKSGFQQSQKEYDWLGHGVYFFQDAPHRALQWIKDRQPGAAPAVIGAVICLDNCVDLLDTRWFQTLRDAYEALKRRCDEDGVRLPRQIAGAHRLDCAVVNFAVNALRAEGHSIGSVRAVFQEGQPLYSESALYDLSHVQISVLDLSAIEKLWVEEQE